MRWSFCLVVASVAFATLARPALAAPPIPVAIGEVTSEVTREGIDMPFELRSVVEQELPAVDMGGRPKPSPAILSVSLVRMERTSADKKTSVTCLVTATVRDKRKGAIVAVLEGRARGENEERLTALLERAVMKSAVRGALARLPEALDLAH
jgi:hypothetical protein